MLTEDGAISKVYKLLTDFHIKNLPPPEFWFWPTSKKALWNYFLIKTVQKTTLPPAYDLNRWIVELPVMTFAETSAEAAC